MDFNMRAWLCGLVAGVLLAGLVAAVPTAWDWLLDPGGVFRAGGAGTNWPVVLDTFASWFLPVLLLVAPFTVLGAAWRAARRGGAPCCRSCR
jgi:hypothetical protein